jgi:hypothetical protein
MTNAIISSTIERDRSPLPLVGKRAILETKSTMMKKQIHHASENGQVRRLLRSRHFYEGVSVGP